MSAGAARGLRLALALAFAAAQAFATTPADAAPSNSAAQATVQEPRAFGYQLGDILTQRILLPDGDRDAVAPPSIGRASAWLDRRRVRIDSDAEGRSWMAIEYQVVNVDPTLTRIALPALTLTSASGAAMQVPEWPVSVGPMTPADTFDAFNTGDLQAMRADRLAPAVPVEPLRRRAGVALALLGLTLLSWAGWWRWRNRREAAKLPFARAWRRIRKLDGANADTSADAWVHLHRALNETAGRVVHAGSLPGLFERAPYLKPLRAQLEQFYGRSAARFFTPSPVATAAPAPLEGAAALRTLSEALYRAERRQQR
ncbi:mxaA protein [Paraburkholderia unamae]|uniref:calcium incorporation protein MxaA n=1 Tax=Paraburkholderia unamae TaxID=219649 RepID=UPI000DC3733C|nr:calcium incorporation protein MxaA [Paraburkholderia unamae]RAR52826.1 mxaA protein [Paraburkholderia unamae]